MPRAACGELASACGGTGRVYAGAADGSVRAIAANTAEESGPAAPALWSVAACASAVTSVCAVEGKQGVLVVAGSASGELVVLCNELELRRFQLESAVQQISYDRHGVFVVGDLLGNLYGVTQYEVLWKTRLPAVIPRSGIGAECFYPGAGQPVVKAIAHARLLDVEKTLSNYVLVATGQKHLLVTHRGKAFGTIPTRTPIGTLASFPVDAADAKSEDVVLGAGEEGVTYRLVSYRDVAPKDTTDFRFAMEKWTQVSFPVAKLMAVKTPTTAENKQAAFTWICLGVDGEVALFRGQECVKQWDFSAPSSGEAFPVDLAVLESGDADPKQQAGVVVFPDRIRTFPVA